MSFNTYIHFLYKYEPNQKHNLFINYVLSTSVFYKDSLLAALSKSFSSLIKRLICWLVFCNSLSWSCSFWRKYGLSVIQSENSRGCSPITIFNDRRHSEINKMNVRYLYQSQSMTKKNTNNLSINKIIVLINLPGVSKLQ